MVAAAGTQGSPRVIRFRRAGGRGGADAPRPASSPGPAGAAERNGPGVPHAPGGERGGMADEHAGPPAADVLARAQEGDVEAFAALVRVHEVDVLRLCRRLLGSATEAEDASQETFARAQVALASYDPQRPFRPWLLAIAAHRSVDLLRRRGTERGLFVPDAVDADATEAAGPSPLDLGLRAEQRRRLLEAIEVQPEKYRAPLLLRYYADLDYAAIADALDVSRNQVATLLFRARQRLRAALVDGASASGDVR